MAYRRLGDLLVGAGAITEEQLSTALAKGKEEGTRLGETLVNMGILTEKKIMETLQIQLGVEFINLLEYEIPVEMVKYIPRNVAKANSIVPVRMEGNTLYLAMEDPLNFYAVEEARKASHKRIVPMIATADGIQRAITKLYGSEGVNKAINDLQESMADVQSNVAAAVSYQENDENAAPTIRLVNSILERSYSEHASDVHVEPREGGVAIRMRVDGVLHNMLTLPTKLQNAVISRIKVMGNMDIAERRIPQDGRASFGFRGEDVDMRISTLPTIYGEKVVIRFLEKSSKLLSTQGIGLEGTHLRQYESLIHNANGVILIAGPTGSGKSTTLYTMVGQLNSEEINITTLEDPVEYNLDGVNQVLVNEKTGMTFANGLRSILRQDPDVIAVGEIRDEETAEIAMRSAITGHLVLSTIHTNSSVATIDRLLDIGIEPYLITSAVKGVIAQRLVRRICPNCKVEYTPDAEELSLMKLKPEDLRNGKLIKGKGCPECHDTGFRGRAGVFEILVLTTEIKNKIRDKAPNSELMEAVNASEYEPMTAHARRLVIDGVTTISEAMKILHTTDD